MCRLDNVYGERSAYGRGVAGAFAMMLVAMGVSSACAEDVDPAMMARGRDIYVRKCQACHRTDGRGVSKFFPPLAQSDWLMRGEAHAVRQVMLGSRGAILFNGTPYRGVMPPQGLTDQQAADVLTYIRNSWGNAGGATTIDEVRAAVDESRGATAGESDDASDGEASEEDDAQPRDATEVGGIDHE